MKVRNHTHWKTAHLKAILQKAAEMELEPERRKRLWVDVVYANRHNSSSGCAHVGGNWAKVRIPKGPKQPNPTATRILNAYRDRFGDAAADKWLKDHGYDEATAMEQIKVHFAKIASHEFAHCRGMRHKTMPTYYTWRGDWKPRVAWAASMPLEVKGVTEKVKPAPVELASQKLDHVLAKEREWRSKVKAAQTRLKGWQTKRRYYERRVAALQPKGED